MAIRLREGRWALSRIVREDDGGFAVAAMRDSLAQSIEAYYPPLNEGRSDYTLPFALVRLQGAVISPPNGDTRLVPAMLVDSTLRDLTNPQRQALRSHLEEWFTGYQFRDYDGTVTVKQAFSAAGYTLDTPLRRVLLDVFGHLGHSEGRLRIVPPETHNTEHSDNFDSDTSGSWTNDGNSPYDRNATDGELEQDSWDNYAALRYSAGTPGSIEHESQVSTKMDDSGQRAVLAGVRMYGTGDDSYGTGASGGTTALAVYRHNAGARTQIATWTLAAAISNDDWLTFRFSAEGAAGANVVLSGWYTDHGLTKPGDPGWIGSDGSPDFTFTDTAANRLDDSTHDSTGICGRGHPAAGVTPRSDFWKSRAISDRAGGGTTYDEAISETATASDTVASSATLAGAISEVLTAAETISSLLTAADQISETATASDTLAGLLQAAGQLAEAAAALDTVASLAVLVGAMTETATATDTVNAGAAVYDMDVAETAAALDTITSQLVAAGIISETAAAADSVTALTVLLGALSEAGTALDTLASAGVLSVSIVEAGTATDSVSAGGILLAAGERIILVRFADRTVLVDRTGRVISVQLAARTIN